MTERLAHIKKLPICPICDAPIENEFTHTHRVLTDEDRFADMIKAVNRLGLDRVVLARLKDKSYAD